MNSSSESIASGVPVVSGVGGVCVLAEASRLLARVESLTVVDDNDASAFLFLDRE